MPWTSSLPRTTSSTILASPRGNVVLNTARRLAAAFRNAFPDIHTTFEDAVAEGDKVAYRWKASGMHEGGLMGIPPTGNRMTITGTAMARISGGRIEEGWQNFDALGMMQQLGVIPEAAGESEEASPT